jgi:hypothetical protein
VTRRFPLLLAVAALSGCAFGPPPGGLAAYKAYDRPAIKPVDPAAVHVKVSTARQRVYVMEADRMLLVMPVSVGLPTEPTPTGDFTILRKQQGRRATDHGYAHKGDQAERAFRNETPPGWSFTGTPLPYWCEFTPGRAFHTGWVKHLPCTDGSIRMHENLAPKFHALVRVGTPVSIRITQPEDLDHANIPLPPDAGPLPDHPATYYVGDTYFTDHLPTVLR